MKSFEELAKEVTLVRYIGSEFGTMYFEPKLPREKKRITRHLDGKLTTEFLPTYDELHKALVAWFEGNSKIQKYVFIPPLIEIGADYIIRPFYVYDIAIRDYMDKDDEDYVEPPELFAQMQTALSQELIETSGKENIIRRILRKSLLEPTSKTFYGYEINKFIIVEPKIALEDLTEWKELSEA